MRRMACTSAPEMHKLIVPAQSGADGLGSCRAGGVGHPGLTALRLTAGACAKRGPFKDLPRSGWCGAPSSSVTARGSAAAALRAGSVPARWRRHWLLTLPWVRRCRPASPQLWPTSAAAAWGLSGLLPCTAHGTSSAAALGNDWGLSGLLPCTAQRAPGATSGSVPRLTAGACATRGPFMDLPRSD